MRAVILDNLRSAWNVGSVFRTSAALNYDHVALCGVTITPPSKKLKDTSRGMEEQVTWSSFISTFEAIQHFKSEGYDIVALESNETALSFPDWSPTEHVAFVLGNEAMGIAEAALAECETMLQLPMLSDQSGINVSCAFAAAAYQDYFRSQANG